MAVKGQYQQRPEDSYCDDCAGYTGEYRDGDFTSRLDPLADSDEVAPAIRDDLAQGCEMISPMGRSLAGG